MELVAPAGNLEKLTYAFQFGADSVYIGLKKFSLRVKADNFFDDEYKKIREIKEAYAKRGMKKKLLCAVNISFHQSDLRSLEENIAYFQQYPIDAFIVQDMGIVSLLRKHFPNTPLHLSTQANCTNAEAVKVYRDLGFSRVVLAREVSLAEIAEIKKVVPEMELECFVHGSMCMAYSGRCLISAYLTGRSANAGACTHSCRWNYKPIDVPEVSDFCVEESERPGEYFPVEQGERYTALFSSKDLCMIDHLDTMKAAGVDALKIEGRMKSLYYTALVTRAYRKKLDALDGKISETEAAPFIEELYNTQHREFSTGFYFSADDANQTTKGSSDSTYRILGTIGACVSSTAGTKRFAFNSMNKLESGEEIEFVGPDTLGEKTQHYKLLEPDTLAERSWVSHGHACLIETDAAVEEGFIVRGKIAT